MPRHTEQKTITYLEIFDYINLLFHRPNTGALLVEEEVGGQWVIVRTIFRTGKYKLFVKSRKLRFTPDGDVSYTVPEGT